MHRLAFTAIILVALPCACRAQANKPVTFKAHEGPVRQVAFSPDGKLLLTAVNGKHALKLWDAATQKLIRDLPCKDSGIIAANFTPDGKQVFATSWDWRVRMWAVATGKLRTKFKAAGLPDGAAFGPKQRRLAISFLRDCKIQIADAATGRTIKTLNVPMKKPPKGDNGRSQVRFSEDGRWLIAVCGGRAWPKYTGGDSVMAIWDARTWTMRARFHADAHNVMGLAISRDGTVIAGGCTRGKTVKLWTTPNVNPKKAVDGATIEKWVKDLDNARFVIRERAQKQLEEIGAQAANALFKATTAESLELRLRAKNLLAAMAVQPTHIVKNGASDVHSLALSPDGKLVAWGNRAANARCLKYCRVTNQPPRSRGPVILPSARGTWSLAFSPDGKQLVTGNADGTVTLIPVSALK